MQSRIQKVRRFLSKKQPPPRRAGLRPVRAQLPEPEKRSPVESEGPGQPPEVQAFAPLFPPTPRRIGLVRREQVPFGNFHRRNGRQSAKSQLVLAHIGHCAGIACAMAPYPHEVQRSSSRATGRATGSALRAQRRDPEGNLQKRAAGFGIIGRSSVETVAPAPFPRGAGAAASVSISEGLGGSAASLASLVAGGQPRSEERV